MKKFIDRRSRNGWFVEIFFCFATFGFLFFTALLTANYLWTHCCGIYYSKVPLSHFIYSLEHDVACTDCFITKTLFLYVNGIFQLNRICLFLLEASLPLDFSSFSFYRNLIISKSVHIVFRNANKWISHFISLFWLGQTEWFIYMHIYIDLHARANGNWCIFITKPRTVLISLARVSQLRTSRKQAPG